MLCASDFGTPDGHDGGEGTCAETGNDTGDEDHVAGLGSGLDGATDGCEDCAEHDTLDTTEPVCDPTADEAAKDAAEVVNCDDSTLVDLVGDDAVRANADFVDIVRA